MVQLFTNLATSFGLSTAAGLNAYIPLLIVALTARYTHWITLQKPWDTLTSPWVIVALVILLLIEMTVDKIPAVDTVNNIIQTLIRPTAGAILFASNSGVIGQTDPALAMIAGLLLAGSVHVAKSTARPVITGASLGTLNPVVSLIEDILALITSLVAIVFPILAVFLVAIMAYATYRIVQRLRSTLAGRGTQVKMPLRTT